MRRICVIFALLLALAGCSMSQTAWGPPVSLDQPGTTGALNQGARRSIGVVSLIGDTFTLKKVGITVFGNDLATASIASWGIDRHASGVVAKELATRADVKQIAHSPEVFAAYQRDGGMFRDMNAELKDGLRKATSGQKHDFYIVLTRSGSQFGSSNQHVVGIGMVQSGSVFVTKTWLHTLFHLGIYDGRTHELLGWKIATIGQERFMAMIKGPHRELDSAWWVDAEKVAGDARLKAAVLEMVQQAVATTLPEALALGPALGTARQPAPGANSSVTPSAVAR